MIYNRGLNSSITLSDFCQTYTVSFHCTQVAPCNANYCDGLACPTGECYTESISYASCEVPTSIDQTIGTSGGGSSGGDGVGGNSLEGIYIPNPYNGDADINNAEFMLAAQVAAYTNTLSQNFPNIQATLTYNSWMFSNIINFVRNNGNELNPRNQNAIFFVLNNISPILNFNPSNFTFVEINQLHYNSFIYLLNNPTAETVSFNQQFITQSQLNPDLNLDYLASLKSPSNIDRSAIDTLTPEGQKFNLVYEELLKSPKFKELFIDLFENSDRFNVKFQIGTVANGADGNTVTDTNLVNPSLNTITISRQFLLNGNKMEIAKTIIHECIHAFLNVKLLDPSQGMSIPNLNNMEFCDIVNQEYNDLSPGQNQHNFIYNYMVPTMVTILSEVKDFLVSTTNNQLMLTDVVVHIPFDNSPATPFVWADYYYNLSLNGIQNCSFFQNEIGTIQVVNGVPTPIITVNQTLMQSFIQYITRGHWNITN
ncbi:hypothetical protein HKT18_03055 [Flavobacterium sp. IMCC34852]|uniref:Uncharacterized protein n=1 Tax=Flavobacterium rivulicola TaxID=2732161 RepID=A0A7Y3R7C3_9FLAO|nr:hypothetical protein [Flavobacterium sp. IMCC34852]NNT71186.1 hypothetical protein [Flavobacterium sp. IMCC34852]